MELNEPEKRWMNGCLWWEIEKRRRRRVTWLVGLGREWGEIPRIWGCVFHHPRYDKPFFGCFVEATEHLRLHAGRKVGELEYWDFWPRVREKYLRLVRKRVKDRVERVSRRIRNMDGRKMRDMRKGAGLRQKEVGPELGVNNDTICRWEHGGKEIEKVYWEAFERLVRDPERVAVIKGGRRRKARREGT